MRHFRETPCRREHEGRDDSSCFVQWWVSIRKNVGKRWRVDSTIPIIPLKAEDRPSWDPSIVDDPATIILLQMEAEEEARLLRELAGRR